MKLRAPTTTRATIIYDGACGLCGRIFPRYGALFIRRGLQPLPLQDPAAESIAGLPRDVLMTQLHVITSSYQQFGGIDAVLYIASAFCWLRLLTPLARRPPIHAALDRGYGWIAHNRYWVFGACHIQSRTSEET